MLGSVEGTVTRHRMALLAYAFTAIMLGTTLPTPMCTRSTPTGCTSRY